MAFIVIPSKSLNAYTPRTCYISAQMRYDCNDIVAAGEVMNQNPGTGTVSCGTVVDLIISENCGCVPASVGDTTVFNNITTSGRRAMPYTMTEDGEMSSISMYHEAGAGGDMILAVYDDNGGPDALIGVTASTPVSASAGWQTIDLTVPVEVYLGETIWLAWVFENNPGIRYKAGTPGRADQS